jgi:hypothetical protein
MVCLPKVTKFRQLDAGSAGDSFFTEEVMNGESF